jgi:hypothetical protein
MAAAVAATKNNKQKIRRHLDAVNVGVGFEFAIMEVVGAFGLFDWLVERKPEPPLVDKAQGYVKPFLKKLTSEAPNRRRLDQREEVSAIDFALPPAVCGKCGLAKAFGVGSAMRLRIAFGRISAGSQSICVALRSVGLKAMRDRGL